MLLHAMGDALVTRDELIAKEPEISAFSRKMVKREGAAVLDLSNGQATEQNVITTLTLDEELPTQDFVPIGVGKPLTVEVRTVYTGRYPRTTWLFGRKHDMLVTSAMKALSTTGAAPRAINFLRPGTHQRELVKEVDPTTIGTPLIFYSPALTQSNSDLKIELSFQEFPTTLMDTVTGLVGEAAGIPLFAPAGPYLYVGGMILNFVRDLGKLGFDRGPEFEATTPVCFDRPGMTAPVADFRVLVDDQVGSTFDNYKLSKTGELVTVRHEKPYRGEHPYVVLSLDGRDQPGYKEFAPEAATAELLEPFFGNKKASAVGAKMALDAMKLYSDWRYREEALALHKQLNDPANADSKQDLQARYDAVVKNIQTDALKPGA